MVLEVRDRFGFTYPDDRRNKLVEPGKAVFLLLNLDGFIAAKGPLDIWLVRSSYSSCVFRN